MIKDEIGAYGKGYIMYLKSVARITRLLKEARITTRIRDDDKYLGYISVK